MVSETRRKRFDPRTPERAAESGVPFLGVPRGVVVKAVPGGRPIITKAPLDFEIPPEFDVSPEVKAERELAPPRPAPAVLPPVTEEGEPFRGFEREPELRRALAFAEERRVVERREQAQKAVAEARGFGDLLRRVYPEKFLPGQSFGISQEDLPGIVAEQISVQVQEDPDAFLQDLLDRGRTPDADVLLKSLGATEEDIEDIFSQFDLNQKVEELINDVFPDEDIENVLGKLETDIDSFIADMRVGGRTKPKQDLLKLMGLSWEQINEVFATQQVVMDIEGIRKLVTILPDNTVADEKGRIIGEVNPATLDFESYQYRIGDTWKSFSAGTGDVIATSGGALKWLGLDGIGEKLSEFGKFLQAQAPPDTLGEFDWDMLYNPRFYATRFARTVPFSLALVPAMIGGAAGGGVVAGAVGLGKTATFLVRVLGATALSRPLESALEAGGAHDEAIAKGLSEIEAKEAAAKVFRNNLALAGVDFVQLAIAFAPSPFKRLGALTKTGLFKVGNVAGRVTFTGLTEAGEEYYQERVQRLALGETIDWNDPVTKEVMAMGGIMGIGLGSAGAVWTSVFSKAKEQLSPELQAQLERDKTGLLAQGLSEEAADLRAWDNIIEREEAARALQDSIEVASIDEFEREVVPESEADKIVWDRTFEQMREQAGIEAITPIEPVAPLTEAQLGEQRTALLARERQGEDVSAEIFEVDQRIAELRGEPPITGRAAPEIVERVPKVEVTELETIERRITEVDKLIGIEGRVPRGTKAELRIERARLEAQRDIAQIDTLEQLQRSREEIETELNNRQLPFHGRVRAGPYAGWTSKQLDAMVDVYRKAEAEFVAVPALPPVTPVAKPPTPKPALEVAEAPPVAVTPEAIPEVDVEVRRQLDELTKMHDIWRNKLATSEQTKASLAKFVRGNLPPNVRGKFITAVAKVKTDAQLQTQLTRVQEVAEQNAQKVLKAEIRKEIKKAKAIVKDKILKGKFTPEVQRRLDVITHNLEIDRDAVRVKMVDNITKSDSGEISHEEMLEANEALNFAGIDGMSSEELSSTLNYIKVLETVGRSERQAKQEANTKRIVGIRTDVSNILTGGQGLKTGVGAVPRKGLATQPGWVDTFVNWQYSLDNLADKLSKLDPTSQPFQSEISKFVAGAHRATAKQVVSTTEQYQNVKRVIEKVYKVKGTRTVNNVLNGLDEEVNLGTFELTPEYKANHPKATVVTIKMTRDEMIAKWMQLQDTTLDNTFRTGMGWSQQVRDAIDTNLTAEEKVLSEEIFNFYGDYYTDVNTIYQELYNVDLPHNQRYSPIRRDLEGDIAENVLTFQDATQYASVINGSLKARIKNIRPLRFNGAIQVLSNHIDQMEHFKAWATTMRDFRRVFGNPEIRQAIEQYHGRGIVQLLDTFMNQMARGGIDTAATNRVADFLRKSFTKSILAIKPVVGLKQIPSLFAYISEMNVPEFFTGVADFWKAPIRNFRFLRENSEGFRARVSQGFERDIRAAQQKHGVNKISGRGGFVDWFLLQIRLADTFAVTQGMWAKMRAGLKAGLTQEEAIAAAEDTTNRTQPSFSIDTLSAIQNGGSWLKLMTMFQNQPNKYFRIIGDNLRNFKYGRGSRTKAASTILLAWVVLPMMFQFIADAFQWKPERQARAAILGPLNFILIGGQLVQSIWGWLTDMPFDYQISPVAQTLRDLQFIVLKAKKLVNQGIDPYKDISVDDVAALLEYLAKAVGQVVGLPTPYFVQVEKQIRKKVSEDEDIDIKDFLFSGWALEPPKKGSEEEVEDLNLLLGEPEEGAEEKSLATGKPLAIYDTADWFGDIGNVYKNVLPQDVIDDPNASKESKAWAEYEIARSKADILPGVSLYKINTEEGEYTIVNYYQQWKAREKIEGLAKLLDYDKQYPKARLGNVSRQQLNILTKYLEAEDKDTFLKEHPELRVNPRNEYLKANPTDNALLALGGQAKILSLEAYNEAKRLIKELDIPEDAIPDFTLPPETEVTAHFERIEAVDEFGANSWEDKLVQAKNPKLREWLFPDSDPIETPIASLELKVKHRSLFEQYDELETDEDRAKLKTDNPEWVDDIERIEAYENNGADFVEQWVERGREAREFGASSSEALVWLLDNPDTYDWAIDNDLLEDRKEELLGREAVLRLNVELSGLEEGSEEFAVVKKKIQAHSEGFTRVDDFVSYYQLPIAGFRQERFLIEHPEFAAEIKSAKGIEPPDYIPPEEYDILIEKETRTPEEELKIRGWDKKVPLKYSDPDAGNPIDDYVSYYTILAQGKPEGQDDWYEDDWFLMEHRAFYKEVYLGTFGNQRADFRNVPTREVFADYQNYLDKSLGKPRKDFRWKLWIEGDRDLEKWLVDSKDFTPIVERVVGVLELRRHDKASILSAIQNSISVEFFNILAPMTKEEILDNLPTDIKIKAIAQLRKKLTPTERLAEGLSRGEEERRRLLKEAEEQLEALTK